MPAHPEPPKYQVEVDYAGSPLPPLPGGGPPADLMGLDFALGLGQQRSRMEEWIDAHRHGASRPAPGQVRRLVVASDTTSGLPRIIIDIVG